MTKRPLWLITLICFMILYQIVWLVRVLQLPDNLQASVSLSVPLEISVSILIVTLFTFGLGALIVQREWAVRYTMGVSILQIGYSLFRLCTFAEADYDRQRLPFLLILVSIVCGLLMLPKILNTIRKSN